MLQTNLKKLNIGHIEDRNAHMQKMDKRKTLATNDQKVQELSMEEEKQTSVIDESVININEKCQKY